jgi:hypothetical protein
MRLNENSILEIQTAESAAIIVYKNIGFEGLGDDMGENFTITEIEGLGTDYWSYSYNNVLNCLNHLENPPMKLGRNFISWWLYREPFFVDNSIKSILRQRLLDYHWTGEIRKNFRNPNYYFNRDNFLEWHILLEIEFDKKLLDLIYAEGTHCYKESAEITIFFDGFLQLPYSRISLKIDLFPNYQNFLNYLFGLIRNEVNQFSYGKEWILFNTISGQVLKKNNLNESSPLSDLMINNSDNIICYKI